MDEKETKHNIKPGIPEALHPEIGNGASFATHKHDFTLLSPDLTKALEDLLPEHKSLTTEASAQEVQRIVHSTQETAPAESKSTETESAKDITPKDQSAPLSAEKPKAKKVSKTGERKSVKAATEASSSKPAGISKPKKVRKEKTDQTKDVSEPAPPQLSQEPEIKNAPKPGKRILKAAKAVKKQQEAKKVAAKKTVAKKTPAKKTVDKKVQAKKASARKVETTAPAAKKVIIQKGPAREKFSLTPFTQWLKELGGADYVHPYDDDFALNQEKGTLNEVISETYADLLAAQGYKDRAIEMYLRLIEKYPEKSSFFAAKIQALQ